MGPSCRLNSSRTVGSDSGSSLQRCSETGLIGLLIALNDRLGILPAAQITDVPEWFLSQLCGKLLSQAMPSEPIHACQAFRPLPPAPEKFGSAWPGSVLRGRQDPGVTDAGLFLSGGLEHCLSPRAQRGLVLVPCLVALAAPAHLRVGLDWARGHRAGEAEADHLIAESSCPSTMESPKLPSVPSSGM